jgi:hypothetical protein
LCVPCFVVVHIHLIANLKQLQNNNRTHLIVLHYPYEHVEDTRDTVRYQRYRKPPCIEEEQTIQCPKETGQKDNQRSTKHYTEN